MRSSNASRGFTLIEVTVSVAIFLIFALGVYGGVNMVSKVVYHSRVRILETALLAEELEVVRNLPFDQVGIEDGVPSGALKRTRTVKRNGVDFTLVTTVRNVDDPFDGTVTGTPRDYSPADYKLVEMSAICVDCAQQEPVILSTQVSPKGLEGATNNGALFIQVFDANGLPVQEASVHVTNTARTPFVIIEDTTDNDGMLRVVDTPTGTLSYHITVNKDGYSSDYTVSSTAQNPNPVRPPANVASQTITEISFSIDRLSNIELSTQNTNCAVLSDRQIAVWGNKKVGTEPDVYKYYRVITTGGGGTYSLSSIEEDTYNISASGTAYDIAGSIPMLPLVLLPNSSQNVSLILRPHTSNSLLVNVKDAGSGLPLSDVAVRLYKTGYDESLTTGLGYTRQTDWSGGGGQEMYADLTRYFDDSGTLDTDSPAGDIKLIRAAGKYLGSGWLESSTIDLGIGVDFRNIIPEPISQPASTTMLLQIAASNSSSPSLWEFVGPDGATSTYYTATNTIIWTGHNGKQFFRYRALLETEDDDVTPQLSELAITFTTSCTPPGQSFFYNLGSGTYNIEAVRSSYITSTGTVDVSGNNDTVINLSTVE